MTPLLTQRMALNLTPDDRITLADFPFSHHGHRGAPDDNAVNPVSNPAPE